MTGAGRPEQPRRAPRRSPRRQPLVLIADDTTDTRELYAEYLSRRFTVVTAHDGAAAIKAALDHIPDVIVMDLAMPQLDGLTAIRRIKSDVRARRTRIILLTGYPQKAVERGALEAGADRFLTKPCLPKELERHVNEVRRSRRAPGHGTRSS